MRVFELTKIVIDSRLMIGDDDEFNLPVVALGRRHVFRGGFPDFGGGARAEALPSRLILNKR